MTSLAVLCALAALVTSIVSGVIGMAGGSMLLVIILTLGLTPSIAIPVHALVQLTSNTTRVWAHRQHVRWRLFASLAIAATPCPIIGIWLLESLDAKAVKAIIGVLILYAAWAPKFQIDRIGERSAFAIAGVLGGTLGVVVGAVGPILAPFFLGHKLNRFEIIATKAISQAYLHILKLVAFTTIGFSFHEQGTLVGPMLVAVVIGTYVGKWLLGKISEHRFRIAYRVIMSLLAIRITMAYFL